MKYWIFNAEQVPTLNCDAADVWFQHDMGFSGNELEKYGEPLRKLKKGHTVLMYQNDKGFVGIGFVNDLWNEKAYQRKLVYIGCKFPEYRISIDWRYDLRETPFSIGWTSPRFLCSVEKPELVERIQNVIRWVSKEQSRNNFRFCNAVTGRVRTSGAPAHASFVAAFMPKVGRRRCRSWSPPYITTTRRNCGNYFGTVPKRLAIRLARGRAYFYDCAEY